MLTLFAVCHNEIAVVDKGYSGNIPLSYTGC